MMGLEEYKYSMGKQFRTYEQRLEESTNLGGIASIHKIVSFNYSSWSMVKAQVDLQGAELPEVDNLKLMVMAHWIILEEKCRTQVMQKVGLKAALESIQNLSKNFALSAGTPEANKPEEPEGPKETYLFPPISEL